MTIVSARPTRRTLVRGAAWSVPAVAVAAAAPAFAASVCKRTLNWASLGNGNTFSSTTVAGITITLTVSGDTGAANNRTVSTVATGGQSSNLRFYSQSNNNTAQSATLSFTKNGVPFDVTDLSFSLLDIDSGANTEWWGGTTFLWSDRVVVGTAGFAAAISNSTWVQGNGQGASSAFRPTNNNTRDNTPGGSTNGNVLLTWASALSSVTFTYSQGGSATGTPFIGISDLSFNAAVC